MQDIITLDYGSGGLKTSQLIDELIVPAFANTALSQLGDGAVLPALEGPPVFSTDSFVVSPWRFPGGDIGKLAVCGTVNDLCMAGGAPRYLSFSLILEEGFALDDLRAVVASAAQTARQAGVQIVTGDTKVVERGRGDGIYINTAGIGVLRAPGLGREALREGDAVLVSGSVGCHGAAVLMARGDLPCEGVLLSDCRTLVDLSTAALDAGGVRMLRDPTRGGVATTLPSILTVTSFSTRSPTLAMRPFTSMRPAAIMASNSRRDPKPKRAKTFCSFSLTLVFLYPAQRPARQLNFVCYAAKKLDFALFNSAGHSSTACPCRQFTPTSPKRRINAAAGCTAQPLKLG